tara:strand:+ start:104 stop:802 length:699 start_codon:yes stop_codon:yes gene_type:complete
VFGNLDTIGTGSVVLSASPTLTGTLAAAAGTFSSTLGVASASASAFAVGLNGATNPAFSVDASTASQAAGLNVLGGTTSGAVAIRILSSGTDNNLTINAKGSGTISIGATSTGAITLGRATTVTGNLTIGSANSYLFSARSRIQSDGDGTLSFNNSAQTSGIKVDFSVNSTLKLRNTSDTLDGTLVAGVGTFSGAVSLGNTVNSVSPTLPNRTVTMVIGGTTYYLSAKTTND